MCMDYGLSLVSLYNSVNIIKEMNHAWGSCLTNRKLTLHLINPLLPPPHLICCTRTVKRYSLEFGSKARLINMMIIWYSSRIVERKIIICFNIFAYGLYIYILVCKHVWYSVQNEKGWMKNAHLQGASLKLPEGNFKREVFVKMRILCFLAKCRLSGILLIRQQANLERKSGKRHNIWMGGLACVIRTKIISRCKIILFWYLDIRIRVSLICFGRISCDRFR